MKSALLPLAALMMLNSCSWYRDVQRSLVEDDEKKLSKSRPVPRAQYDQLLVKYEELSKKYELLKENPKEHASLVDEVSGGATQVEVVDAFAGHQDSVTSTVETTSPDVESQLALFRRGVALKESNPGEATKIFQQLEAQSVPAIKARSKVQIGELLYSKGQYDIALQVFEDVISKHVYSGAVLEALKYAVICSDKLGIQNKKDQYASMLNDVFETN